MRRDRPADLRTVGYALHNSLDGALGHAERVMGGKVVLDECLDPRGHGDDPTLGARPVGSSLSVDRDPVSLPIDVVTGELRELADPEPGVQKRPDDEALLEALARVGKPGRLLLHQGLSFVLVGHVAYYSRRRQSVAIRVIHSVTFQRVRGGGLPPDVALSAGRRQRAEALVTGMSAYN